MKKINNKGFTLIEILGAIVILGILMGIGVGAYTRYRKQTAETSYDLIKKNAITAAENYFIDNTDEDEVTLQELVSKSYLETIQDPLNKDKECSGNVSIFDKTRASGNSLEKNSYMVNLVCSKHKSCLIMPNSLECDAENGIQTDGESSYYSAGLANHNFNDSMTLVARVRFNGFPENDFVDFFGNLQEAGGGLGISYPTHNFYFNIFTTTGKKEIISNVEASKNVWYIVVGSFSEGKIKLYLDGRLIASADATGAVTQSPMEMIIGGNPQPDGQIVHPVSLSVTDIVIFDTNISEAQITQNFSNPKKAIRYQGTDALYNKTFSWEE